ncbi:MAG: MFS transporter, partial [Chloroflexota bacterium]
MIAMFLTPGNMRWLLISRGVRSFSQALLVITAPLYFAALGNSSTHVGLLLSVGAVGSTVLTLTTGFAADRVGRRPLLVLIAVLSGLGAAVLGLNGAFALLALGGALCTVGGGGGATSGGSSELHSLCDAVIAVPSRITARIQELHILLGHM